MTAVVAFALFLSTLGTTGAGLYGGAAVLAFLASLLCFAADRRRPETELIRRTRGAATMAEI